jgi:hypothetical protein
MPHSSTAGAGASRRGTAQRTAPAAVAPRRAVLRAAHERRGAPFYGEAAPSRIYALFFQVVRREVAAVRQGLELTAT